VKQLVALALAVGTGAAAASAYWLLWYPRVSMEVKVDALVPAATEFAEQPVGDESDRNRKRVVAPSERQAATPLTRSLTQNSQFARARSIAELAEKADVDELHELLTEARTLGDPASRRLSLDLLLLRLFELDPANAPRQALEETLAIDNLPLRGELLAIVGNAWARVNPVDAWRYAMKMSDPATRATFEQAVVARWGLSDPEAAFGGVVGLPASGRKDQLLRQVAGDLVRADPQRAVSLALGVNRADRRATLMNILSEWAQQDAPAAAQWLESNPGKVNRMVAFQIASAYGVQNPVEALDWAQRFDRGSSRGSSLAGTVLSAYAEENPADALRLAMTIEAGAKRGQAITAVLGAAARRDPTFAMDNLDKVSSGQYRSQAVMNIAMQIVRSDPRAAVEWVKSVNDEEARADGLQNLAQALASSDPETATSLTDEIPSGLRADWIAAVASAYVQQDPEAAVRWARPYLNDPAYPQIFWQVVSRLAMNDPEAAFELAATAQDPQQRDQAIASTVGRAAHASPETAVRWIARISDERMRARATGNLASQWAQIDASAARKWVTSLPLGAARDEGLSRFVGSAFLPVEEASSLIGQIQSQDRRMDAVMMTARRLGQRDVEAARTLLRRHPLDPQRQQELTVQLRDAGVTL
jgi:hypothetical protein